MKPISVDELPDFLQKEFPQAKLTCLADFARDGIVIQKGDVEVVLFKEAAFDEDLITEEGVRKTVSSWLENKG